MTLRIAVTGATGLIGTALTQHLASAGHTVVPVSRRPLRSGIRWDPAAGVLPAASLEGFDAVVHLAGAGIADKRWTAARKRTLVQSRTVPTGLLANTLATLGKPPRALISASAVGIYGDRDDTVLTDDATPGQGFLADLAQMWEQAADPARNAGIRVVHPRLGVVLTNKGGALPRMLMPFRLGVAGRLGSGRQWMSWITLRDVVAAIAHLIADDTLHGAVNVSTPAPITNAEFTRELAHVLHRPAVIPVPALTLKLLFGEMATATLLASQRAMPSTLQSRRFSFADPALSAALHSLLDNAG